MATFEKILEQGLLVSVVVRLGRGKIQQRELYAFPDCLRWMKETVPTLATGRLNSALKPAEQLIMRLQQWLSGDPISRGPMFKEMQYPRGNDVWELKTDDLRLFGWMYRPRKLIIASHGYADHYKDPTKSKFYADDVRAVIRARDSLPLDDPKLVRGSFNDLV